jgi:hypothetical protein
MDGCKDAQCEKETKGLGQEGVGTCIGSGQGPNCAVPAIVTAMPRILKSNCGKMWFLAMLLGNYREISNMATEGA